MFYIEYRNMGLTYKDENMQFEIFEKRCTKPKYTKRQAMEVLRKAGFEPWEKNKSKVLPVIWGKNQLTAYILKAGE